MTRAEIEELLADAVQIQKDTQPGTFYPIEPVVLESLCRSLIAAEERAEGSAAEERASEEYSFRLKVEAREAVLRGALAQTIQSGDDIAEMAHCFIDARDLSGLRNYGSNIASLGRAALASTGSEAADK